MKETEALNPLEAYVVVKAVAECSYETRKEVAEKIDELRDSSIQR